MHIMRSSYLITVYFSHSSSVISPINLGVSMGLCSEYDTKIKRLAMAIFASFLSDKIKTIMILLKRNNLANTIL